MDIPVISQSGYSKDKEWFAFCENSTADPSEWVDMEQAYISNSGKEMIWKIDMTEDIGTILNQVRTICADIEVFILYTNSDCEVAKVLEDVLLRKDYSGKYKV